MSKDQSLWMKEKIVYICKCNKFSENGGHWWKIPNQKRLKEIYEWREDNNTHPNFKGETCPECLRNEDKKTIEKICASK